MFWELKGLFPGDADFAAGAYGDLNYGYVLSAVRHGRKRYRVQLHDAERPIAQQTAVIANQNRDPKRQRKAFSFEDFSLYRPLADNSMPSGHYGAAAMTLIKRGLYPAWALFCFKDLSLGATPDYEPAVPALFAETAILLHPKKVEGGYKGLLIAQETASAQTLLFTDQGSEIIPLVVPHIHTKVIAEEDVVLLRP